MKQIPFKLKDAYKPTEQSILEQNRRLEMYRYYGISVGVFGTELEYTEDERQAIKFIMNNNPVPKELETKLLKSKTDRLNRMQPRQNNELMIKNAELDAFIAEMINKN